MKRSLSSGFTLLASVFFLAEGIWGWFRPVIFGVLTTNHIRASIHIVLGLVGLFAFAKGARKTFLGFLGSYLLVVAVLWFLPATRGVPASQFNVNGAVATLNLVLGVASLAFAVTEPSRRRVGAPAGTARGK